MGSVFPHEQVPSNEEVFVGAEGGGGVVCPQKLPGDGPAVGGPPEGEDAEGQHHWRSATSTATSTGGEGGGVFHVAIVIAGEGLPVVGGGGGEGEMGGCGDRCAGFEGECSAHGGRYPFPGPTAASARGGSAENEEVHTVATGGGGGGG